MKSYGAHELFDEQGKFRDEFAAPTSTDVERRITARNHRGSQ
jgi:hypothetical protein